MTMRAWLPATALILLCSGSASAQERGWDADDRLSETINRAMEADGPWLLPAEQAVIARKCGYTAEEADRDSITINNGALVCANGRRVDNDPEVTAMMELAGARISRRVSAIMESPAIRNAISALADEAVREALEGLREGAPRRSGRR